MARLFNGSTIEFFHVLKDRGEFQVLAQGAGLQEMVKYKRIVGAG